MKNKYFWIACLQLLGTCAVFAQSDSARNSPDTPFMPAADTGSRYHIAVFAPLYLDSAFDASLNYRYGKTFPKYINAGLEFYEGMQLAADSLRKEGLDLDIHVYDSRSAATSVAAITKSPVFDSMHLVIGHVNASEARVLAGAVARRNIPFINANYPNDAGVSNNPNFIVLNSTLYTHCSAIYKFIQKNYALGPVIVFRKKGQQEDKLKTYFEELTKNTASVPLKIRYVTLDNNFTPEDLSKHLDDATTTACIAGSLDVNFGQVLAQQLASLAETHPSVVFAMPTWWDAPAFAGTGFKGIDIIHSTPFYLPPTHPLVARTQQEFRTRFYSRPTEMVFLGCETLYHFAHLLRLHGSNLSASLSDKRFSLFTGFDVQPVLNPRTNTLDYFENKKIFLIRKTDGAVTAVH